MSVLEIKNLHVNVETVACVCDFGGRPINHLEAGVLHGAVDVARDACDARSGHKAVRSPAIPVTVRLTTADGWLSSHHPNAATIG